MEPEKVVSKGFGGDDGNGAPVDEKAQGCEERGGARQSLHFRESCTLGLSE